MGRITIEIALALAKYSPKCFKGDFRPDVSRTYNLINVLYIRRKFSAMYPTLLHLHSGFRYVVSILLILSIILSFAGWFGKSAYTEGNRKLNLFTLISAHIQLLLGLVLYFVSPFVQFNSSTMKTDALRYWTVEHITMMIIAIVLITIGHSKSKKAVLPVAKHKTIAIFYTIALVIIVLAILASKRSFFGIS